MSRKKPHLIKRDSPDLRTLGRRLRELRGFDLTQGELAKELGISQSQLSKYERGVAAPPADILFYIKHRFEVSIDWLLTGEGLKESNST
jgi:transcriptional regulator with XRE-family HTH domain